MTLKLRAKVNFPATVTASGGLQVVKSNGIWTVSPKWTDLTLETTLPDAAGRQLWTLDPVSNVYYRLSVQALVDNLPAGPTGPTGPIGPTPGIRQAYSTTTTDSDPGAGTFRLNNATPASATAAYLDNADSGGATVSGIIDRFDDSTNTIKGVLRFEKSGDPTVWAEFNVTGSVVDGTGYRKLTLASGAGSGTFTDTDVFAITFTRAGDAGTNGAVAVSGTPTVNQIAAWVDSTTVKGVSITGLVKGNGASAPTAAVAGTDYAVATSGSSILKGNGAGGFSAAVAGTDYQAADAQLFSNIPQNSQSAAYTLVATDAQKHIYHPFADNNARTFTIPANASVAYPIGTAITFINLRNTLTIAITTDTLILAGPGTTGSRSLAQYGVATAIKITSTEWIISGTGLT